MHAAGTTWHRQVASAVRQLPERRDPYASTFAYCTSNPLLQLLQRQRSVLLQVILAAQLAWMLGVRVRGVGIGDEARFGHGGVSLSAIAALSVPSTLQGVNPEMGLMRTMRFAILSGVAVGCAGEMWFRRLLRKMPGFTYEAVLRGVFDQVRTP